MPVVFVTGDLFRQHDIDALAHGTNTVGVMGSGIAPLFRRRQPDMYAQYRQRCLKDAFSPGDIFPWALSNGRWIYNLMSQQHTGADARLDAIETSVTAALTHAAAHNLNGIALPRIGSGVGGLNWAEVRDVLTRLGDTSPLELRVVSLPNAETNL